MSDEHALYLFGSHFTTEHLNLNWSQQEHTYSGTCFCETNLSKKLNCICFLVVATCDCCMLVTLARASAFGVFLTDCLFDCLYGMCGEFSAISFLKEHHSISMTCSGFNFFFW